MSCYQFRTTGSPSTRLQQLTDLIAGMGEGRLTDGQAAEVAKELREIAKMMEVSNPTTPAREQDQKWVQQAQVLLAGPLSELSPSDLIDLALTALRTADERRKARGQGN